MRVAIAGSHTLPHGHAGRLLITFLVSLPEDAVILMRRGRSSPANHFESQVSVIASTLGLKVEWLTPEKNPLLRPHQTVWERDLKLVHDSDLVLCFYALGDGDDSGGTRGLLEKATDANTPVYGYLMSRVIGHAGWMVELDGFHDPAGEWTDKVPHP